MALPGTANTSGMMARGRILSFAAVQEAHKHNCAVLGACDATEKYLWCGLKSLVNWQAVAIDFARKKYCSG